MPTIGDKLYDVDHRRWTVRAVKPPKGRDRGFVNFADSHGASLTLPWLPGVEVVEKSAVWKLWFGEKAGQA